MKKLTSMFVILALTQAVLLSALAATLVSLAPAANASSDCSSGHGINPGGKTCGNPHSFGNGAPPAPSCKSPNHFKNSDTCRL